MNTNSVLPYLRLITLQSGPQDIPYSTGLLSKALLLYLITGLLVLLPGSEDLFTSVALMALDLVMLLVFLKFCLYTRNTQPRFVQTLTACLGVGVVFQLLALPLVLFLNTAEANSANNTIGGLFYLLLISWQVTVMAHILRHAMNMMISLTLLLSFSYFLLMIVASNQLVRWLVQS